MRNYSRHTPLPVSYTHLDVYKRQEQVDCVRSLVRVPKSGCPGVPTSKRTQNVRRFGCQASAGLALYTAPVAQDRSRNRFRVT